MRKRLSNGRSDLDLVSRPKIQDECKLLKDELIPWDKLPFF
jgi:hypothetical protein